MARRQMRGVGLLTAAAVPRAAAGGSSHGVSGAADCPEHMCMQTYSKKTAVPGLTSTSIAPGGSTVPGGGGVPDLWDPGTIRSAPEYSTVVSCACAG